MNCCNGNCNQGRNCPVKVHETSMATWVVKFFAIIGIYAFIMFFLGYLWASTPLVKERTCTPDLMDRIFK